MSAKWHRGAPELTWGTLWVTCDNSPTFDGTGPQNAPEGTVDMNSIDNLREYALTAASVNATTRAVLAGYVDEIEREVEQLREREYQNGREDAKGAVEFADRLKAAVDKREDVTLFGVDYTPLPVDADGVPIHVGERVQLIGNDPSTVSHMSLAGDGWRVYVKYDGDLGTGSGEPSRIRHHHAPTVEDVLQELTNEVWNRCCEGATASDSGIDELVAEYAAKLMLKED